MFDRALEAEITRRDLLRGSAASALFGLAGLSLRGVLGLRSATAASSKGASALYDGVIFIHYDGGPSQTDTWDPKPGHPNNEFGTLPLSARDVYGQPIHVAEHFQNLRALVENEPSTYGLGLLRSMSHRNEEHTNAQLWVNSFTNNAGEAAATPATAASLSYLLRDRIATDGLPPAVVVNFTGAGADEPRGARVPSALRVDANNADLKDALLSPPNVDVARAARRRALARKFGERLRGTRPDASIAAWDEALGDASELTLRGRAAQAFEYVPDVALLPGGPVPQAYENESRDARRRLTLARNLVLAGIPYVSVGIYENDTHGNNRERVRVNWGGITDPAVAAMAADFNRAGKRVLIVMGGEFGRTPHTVASNPRRDGRDHWGSGFSWALLSIGQSKFRTTAVGDTGTGGMAKEGSGLKDPIATGTVGGLVYRCLGIPVGDDARAKIPGEAGPMWPVREDLARVQAPALMAKLGLPPL